MGRIPPEGGNRRSRGDSRSTDFTSETSRRRFLTAAGASLGATGIAGLTGCLVRGDPSHLEGEIVVDGSNTLLPHGAAVAEEFQWRNNQVRIPVRGSGTGAGFQLFCNGETDVQNASRRIQGPENVPDGQISEVEQCREAGVDYLECEVALDGIAIWVHPDNDWCDCLTTEELRRIWNPDSEVETWGDVREEWREEGRDEEIDLYGRDPASGTFDSFTKAINDEVGRIRSDYSASADTNVIVRGVRGSKHALGWGGLGFYEENKEDLKLVDVDDGDGCVTPTRETIETETYQPLTRSMFVYFNENSFEREEVREYARFYFSPIDEQADQSDVEPDEELAWTQWAARKVGYYATSDESVRRERDRIGEVLTEYE